MTGDYGLVWQAFELNPMVSNGDRGEKVMNELFVAHEKYLPLFAEKIKELKEAGISPQDEVVKRLLKEGK